MVTGHSRFRRSVGRAERELWPHPWRVGNPHYVANPRLSRCDGFTRYELEHLLARAGFHDVSIYGDFDRSPCVPGCPELVVVATKG